MRQKGVYPLTRPLALPEKGKETANEKMWLAGWVPCLMQLHWYTQAT